jgi:predicted small integral membrane protein
VIVTEAAYLVILKIVGALALFSDQAMCELFLDLTSSFHFSRSAIATNEPYPGNIFCAVHSHRCTLYAYVGILVVETMFLGMALRKAWMHRASKGGSRLMRELTRDSVFYFFM